MTGDVSIFIQLRKQNKGEIGLNPSIMSFNGTILTVIRISWYLGLGFYPCHKITFSFRESSKQRQFNGTIDYIGISL